MRNLFSFPTAQTENKSWTKLEKQIGEKFDESILQMNDIEST